jgi:hypothetical protein
MTQARLTIPLIVTMVMLLLFLLQQTIKRSSHVRALRLLKDWLTAEQLACYERSSFFEVIGSHSGNVFRIHHGTQSNIEELSNLGAAVCRWCFVPLGNLAAGDVMLAQKIALETDEPSALAVANRLMAPERRPLD